MEYMIVGCAIVVLGIAAIPDIRTKEIPGVLLGIELLLGVIAMVLDCKDSGSIVGAIWDLIPGILLLSVAYFSGEKMGYGDGLMVVAFGLILGWEQAILALFIALFGASICSILLMAFWKAKRTFRIPFLPFLFLGTLIVLGGTYVSNWKG